MQMRMCLKLFPSALTISEKTGSVEWKHSNSDAVRREVVRIQSATGKYDFSFHQVIDKITSREHDVHCCYGKGTPFMGKVLVWMMARDACFILEFFRNHLCGLQGDDDDFKNDFFFLPNLHPIFGPESENPGVKSEIMKDLIKLDNQIPLFILEDVLAMEMGSPNRGRAKLEKLLRAMFDKIYYRPFEFRARGESPRKGHILDIYHYSCLGVVVHENENCENVSNQLNEWGLKVPSAVQLKDGGVKFQSNGKNVDDIRFEGETLTMVPLKLDMDSEVYIRNLIALEICSPDYKHKIMTAYAKFLYELCQTDKGVNVMREAGVIIGNLWHSNRVTRLLSVSNFTISQPACKSIKETREKLSSCYKTKRSIMYRSLWIEFWKAYGSKPWLIVGGWGATIVLFLTAIQVFCLFITCGASTK